MVHPRTTRTHEPRPVDDIEFNNSLFKPSYFKSYYLTFISSNSTFSCPLSLLVCFQLLLNHGCFQTCFVLVLGWYHVRWVARSTTLQRMPKVAARVPNSALKSAVSNTSQGSGRTCCLLTVSSPSCTLISVSTCERWEKVANRRVRVSGLGDELTRQFHDSRRFPSTRL